MPIPGDSSFSVGGKAATFNAKKLPKGSQETDPQVKEPVKGAKTRDAMEVSSTSKSDGKRENLVKIAREASAASRNQQDGRGYAHVVNFMEKAGVLRRDVPDTHARHAYQFADLVDPNPSAYGLRKLAINNPADAPKGSIVVLDRGAPGAGPHGHIAVADGQGFFHNGGATTLRRDDYPPGSSNFSVYVPE